MKILLGSSAALLTAGSKAKPTKSPPPPGDLVVLGEGGQDSTMNDEFLQQFGLRLARLINPGPLLSPVHRAVQD